MKKILTKLLTFVVITTLYTQLISCNPTTNSCTNTPHNIIIKQDFQINGYNYIIFSVDSIDYITSARHITKL